MAGDPRRRVKERRQSSTCPWVRVEPGVGAMWNGPDMVVVEGGCCRPWPTRPVRRLAPDITTEELKKIRREVGPGPAAPNAGWWVPREDVDEGEDTGGGRPPDAA